MGIHKKGPWSGRKSICLESHRFGSRRFVLLWPPQWKRVIFHCYSWFYRGYAAHAFSALFMYCLRVAQTLQQWVCNLCIFMKGTEHSVLAGPDIYDNIDTPKIAIFWSRRCIFSTPPPRNFWYLCILCQVSGCVTSHGRQPLHLHQPNF